ncbi:LysR family transcriptional regulator [Vibrio ishigakensis]|uniref:LysR family transcriptional regulator n=1 Tax=Vibrio ishigakensis TaxID=1481914 RepID=UPI0021C4A9FF|nr:LysR family transcriptional regulator [Vibrio ishigakensis]
MTAKELAYFVTLVETQNFTRASEKLFVTQPTISKALKSLEDSAGQPLVHRKGRDIELTEAGKVVYEHAITILNNISEMQQRLDDIRELKSGHITIGIPPMVGHLYTELLQEFSRSHPSIEVTVVEGGGRKIEQDLLSGDIDVALSMLPTREDRFEYESVGDYPIYAVLPKDDKWLGESKLELTELKDIPFYLYTSEFTITQIIERLCKDKGFVPRVGIKSSQWDFLAAMVKSGLGVSFIPEPICRNLNPKDYCFRELSDELRWRLALMWSRERYLSKASQAFVDLVKSRT